MPDSTSQYALPYQTLSDPPDGPALGQDLAEAVETELLRVDRRPVVRLVLGLSGQTFTNNVQAAISWSTTNGSIEVWDTDNFHSLSTNPSRVTPTVAGLYRCAGTILWSHNASGDRRSYIGLNGTALAPVGRAIANGDNSLTTAVQRLVACNGSTDYIELLGFQSSGGNLDATGTGSDSSTFSTVLEVVWERPLP